MLVIPWSKYGPDDAPVMTLEEIRRQLNTEVAGLGNEVTTLGRSFREFTEMQRSPGDEMNLDNTINNPGWGEWSSWAYCPVNHYVCGLSQRVFPPGGSDVDDTAMAGIRFRCCPLIPNGSR